MLWVLIRSEGSEVAQSDAHSTADQEVVGSTPAMSANILSWRLISHFRWFKKGSCRFLAKECAQYWLTT